MMGMPSAGALEPPKVEVKGLCAARDRMDLLNLIFWPSPVRTSAPGAALERRLHQNFFPAQFATTSNSTTIP